ncbi:hypothetical protein BDF21DRAFT_402898 [Thamnidium elegans]|nr:hypothetical protein BDF21DRAFT_402898 [Thamnidium elegans]
MIHLTLLTLPLNLLAALRRLITRQPTPVRGVGRYLAHAVLGMIQYICSNAAEGFKYPLAGIDTVENLSGRQVPPYVIYDVVCRLKPKIIKLLFFGWVRVFWSFWYSMRRHMSYTIKLGRTSKDFSVSKQTTEARFWHYCNYFGGNLERGFGITFLIPL